ncbi:DNA polymerase ligase-domain-containing protein [Tirmania nivea]|nr:DNA polymerase ligase-domain-containing protein [Tirmania nivea]
MCLYESDGEDIEYLRAVSDHEVIPEPYSSALIGVLRSLRAPISPPLSPIKPNRKRKADEDYVSQIKLTPDNSSTNLNYPSGILDTIDEPSPSGAFAKYLSGLKRYSLPQLSTGSPRITFDSFTKTFYDNLNPAGHHYVIHQHDHPRAGLHYDLRLQVSESNTVSWAVPKGLPCNAKSRAKRRLAVETRVHPYWYSVVEGGSTLSGTTIVWDCGVYEIIAKRDKRPKREETPIQDGESESEVEYSSKEILSEPQKLYEAFQRGSIHISLKGTRIKSSVFSLRLSQNQENRPYASPLSRPMATASTLSTPNCKPESKLIEPPELKSPEMQSYRMKNAYPHSSNMVKSFPQRTWFLTRKDESEDSFVVWGKDVERSVVTGRKAMEVQVDLEEKDGVAGMKSYQGRQRWEGIYD